MELERIRSGESEALGLLLRDTWAPLVRYLLNFLDSAEAAEDAAQEAYVRLWERRDSWEAGSARALIFRIGRNLALDLRRKEEVRRRWRRDPRRGAPESPPTPEEELAGSEFLLRLQEALAGLTQRRQEAFDLVRFRGLSCREAAEVLEVSERTVANHLSLAMRDLRRLLPDLATGESMEAPTDAGRGRAGGRHDG